MIGCFEVVRVIVDLGCGLRSSNDVLGIECFGGSIYPCLIAFTCLIMFILA